MTSKQKFVRDLTNTCRYFNGIHRDDPCGKGVDVRELVGGSGMGWALRMPCVMMSRSYGTVPCAELSRYTEEEALNEWAEIRRRVKKQSIP